MSEEEVATNATSATAPRGVDGKLASQPISRHTGGELAMTYPPKIIITICMVKGINPQNPSPNLSAKSDAGQPKAQPATNTMSVMRTAKTKASGNHRSIQLVKAEPKTAKGMNPASVWPVSALVSCVVGSIQVCFDQV